MDRATALSTSLWLATSMLTSTLSTFLSIIYYIIHTCVSYPPYHRMCGLRNNIITFMLTFTLSNATILSSSQIKMLIYRVNHVHRRRGILVVVLLFHTNALQQKKSKIIR